MQIQHNIAAINANRNLGVNKTNLNKNLEKLSSGFRINRSADDAAGLAISEQMRSKINGLDQATSNAKDAIGLIQTTEGALTETHSMLQRMKTLATQAANGTYNSTTDTTAREGIQKEMEELQKEITRLADNTDYNGIKPISAGGSAGNMQFQIGPTSKETLTLAASKMDSKSLGVSALASKMLSVKGANSAITAIDKAINKVSSYRADLGAKQNRLEHTINSLKTTSENMTDAESRIRDTDMATEIASYTKNNILNQAAQSMLAQANQQPQQVLSLLG